VLKCPPPATSAWFPSFAAERLLAREASAYGMLATRRELGDIVPQCLWSRSDADGAGVIALEDLSERGAVNAPAGEGLSLQHASAATRALAVLHATHARIDSPLDPMISPFHWAYTGASEGLHAMVREGLESMPAVVHQRFPSRSAHRALFRFMHVDPKRVFVHAHRASRLRSLCHGDPWLNNVMFTPGEPAGLPGAVLVDWQFAMWGNPLTDVSLLVTSSLNAADRRRHTVDLLRDYHETLLASAGGLRYSFESCRVDYRMAFAVGALVALASLDTYSAGLSRPQAEHLERRMVALAEDLSDAWREID